MTFHQLPGTVFSLGTPSNHANVGNFADDCAIPAEVGECHLAQLVRAVEGEIVPRLMMARRSAEAIPVPANVSDPGPAESDELARLLLQHDVEIPYAYAETLFMRGVSVRDLYVRLLAPAARRLGDMWESDECDFMQVTLGLGRLHQLLRRIGSLDSGSRRRVEVKGAPCALLATVPGETHSFGISMISHFFQRRGWTVFNEFPRDREELAAAVGARAYDLVCLSSGSDALLDMLASAVDATRKQLRRRRTAIMVGGALLLRRPELVRHVGADATASDGEQAVTIADRIKNSRR